MNSLTLEQFGATIKEKYPEYSSYSDLEIGQKMLLKYPQYNDRVVVPEPVAVPKKDLLQRTGSVVNKIFPGKQVGETIGTLGASITKRIQGKPDEAQMIEESAPKVSQVLGDVVSGGLNIAGLKGLGSAGGIIQRVLGTLGLGAGLGASQAISEGGSPSEVAKSAAIGGAVGAALPVAGAGLRAIGRQIETLPARFVNSALSRSKAQVLNDIANDKVDDFAKYVLESKPIGSANTLLKDSFANIGTIDRKVNEALAASVRKTGNKITIGRNNLLDEIAKLPEAEGALLKREDIRGIVEKLAPQAKKLLQKESLTLEEANKLRSLIDRTLGDRGFLSSQLSSDKAILKSFANTLRETVKSKAPEGTRSLFAEYANEIRFRDGLLDKIAQRAGNQVLSFGDFIGGGLGGIFGGGLPGAIAGVATRRAIESVPFKLTSAKTINALTKLAPVFDGLAPAQQTAILQLIADLVSDDESSRGSDLQ